MATVTYNNLGPIYLTQEKFNNLLDNDALEAGREYKIIDWEAQEKLIAGNNITIADDGKTISAADVDLSSYATQDWVNENKMSWLGDKGNVPEWKTDDPGAGYAFHIPYRFEFTPDANKLDIKMYTITADGNNTYNEWDNTVPPANSIEAMSYLNAGLMTSADATALRTTIPNTLSTMATQSWVEDKGYLTSHQDLSGYVDTSNNQDIYGDKTFHSPVAYGTGLNATFLDDKKFRTTGAMSPERTYNLPEDNDLEVTLASRAWVEEQNYLTEHQSLDDYATQDWVDENYSTVALKPMKEEWTGTNLTTQQAADAILGDADTKVGDGFLGEVSWSDMWTSIRLMNGEVKAFVVSEDIVQFEITSSTTEPYAWFYNSFAEEWRTYVPLADNLTTDSTYFALTAKQGKALNDTKQDKLTAGTGITIENNVISASGTTDISGKVDKSTTEKETVYTGSSSTQYNRELVNDIISTPSAATDEMIPTAKAVVDAISASNSSDYFLATYDETSFADIKTAYEAGKLLKLKYAPTGNAVYYADLCQVAEFDYSISGDQGTTFYFSCPKMYWSLSPVLFEDQGVYYFAVYRGKGASADTWSVKTVTTTVPNASTSTVGGIKLYNDSDNNVLYITNDGTDPTPST